jgi:RHS repeat-associated protein
VGAEIQEYSYFGNMVLEERSDSKMTALLGWSRNGLVSRIDASGSTVFYLTDALGSVVALVDEKANLVQSNEYSAFGEALSGRDSVNAFRFVGGSGGQTDDSTGLVYFWNRWFDPSIGRWVSEDPIGQAGGVNLYGYVKNRPSDFIDSFGLWEFQNNAGFHVPDDVAPYQSTGPNVASRTTSEGVLESVPTTMDRVIGTFADIGVSTGIGDISGTDGKCAGGTINIGMGDYGGVQITLRKDAQLSHPSTWIDGVSVGLGLGISLPVSYTRSKD